MIETFEPKEEYVVTEEKLPLGDIRVYPDRFILRPPYQRHAGVWEKIMKEQFLDSLCRRYYIPRIVLRRVRFDNSTTKWEVIDGQQRLSTLLEFFDEKSDLRLPDSLKDLNPDLIGRRYHELEPNKREWFDKQLFLKADIILSIEEKDNPQHLRFASDLFWRLQQGEPLTFIETLHSKLSSNVRNFVSKYADTSSFDFEKYASLDENKDIHPFFEKVIDVSNERMQYLLLLTRFLLIENDEGPTDVGDKKIKAFFDKFPIKNKNLIDREFEENAWVKNCIANLNAFYEIYKNNSTISDKNGVLYLKKDYYIMSLYLLLRHLRKYYVFDKEEYKLFDKFSMNFYQKLIQNNTNDLAIMQFRENRQQSKENLEIRDRIIRQFFFKENSNMKTKDPKRFFDESQKIEIYHRDKGLCQKCLQEFKEQGLDEATANEKAKVQWSDYEADHIIAHIKGGKTTTEEGQLLCRTHNREKKDK